MSGRVYFDYNAGGALHPLVCQHLQDQLKEDWGNPLSVHKRGQKSHRVVENVRNMMAHHLNCHPDHIIFTGSGTESNNHALRGGDWDRVLISSIEHDSVFRAHTQAELITTDNKGHLDLDQLREKLESVQSSKTLVSVTLACGETGLIPPFSEICSVVKSYGAYLHVDATQYFGRGPLPDISHVDLLTLSPHKFGALSGIGILMARETVPLQAFVRGGGQEKNRRGGTHNLFGIMSLGVILENMPNFNRLREYHTNLEAKILEYSSGRAHVIGMDGQRLPNVTNIATPGVNKENQLIYFDLNGIEVSGGAACSSGKVGPSRILKALGYDDDTAQCSIRLSSGWDSEPEDFDVFFAAWSKLFDQASGKKGEKK